MTCIIAGVAIAGENFARLQTHETMSSLGTLLLGIDMAMQLVDLWPIAVYWGLGGTPVSEERAISIAKVMSDST